MIFRSIAFICILQMPATVWGQDLDLPDNPEADKAESAVSSSKSSASRPAAPRADTVSPALSEEQSAADAAEVAASPLDAILTPTKTTPPPPPAETQPLPAPTGYKGQIEAGHAYYFRREFDRALEAYQAAKESQPGDQPALYFIACSQVKLAQYLDAISTLKALATVAGEQNPSMHARALFNMAIIEELSQNHTGAVEAWTVYMGFAKTHANVATLLSTAEQRLKAYETKREMEEKYKPVRDRISGSR